MHADVGVGPEVGHVIVGARRGGGVRLHRRGPLPRWSPDAPAAEASPPRPARPRQVAVAVSTAGKHEGESVVASRVECGVGAEKATD